MNTLEEIPKDQLDHFKINVKEWLDLDSQIKELEKNCSELIKKVNLSNKDKKEVLKTIMSFCENYEKLCQKKYPEAPLPLEILKSIN